MTEQEKSSVERLVLDVSGCLADRLGARGIERPDLEADLDKWSRLASEVQGERAKGRHGYLDLERARKDADEAVAFAGAARGRFRRMIQCGIGGSTMGNIAAHTALPGDREVTIVDNVDPTRLRGLEGDALRESIVHVVTKSGETAEVVAMLLVMVERLRASVGARWREHLVITTDPEKGALRAFARDEKIRTFEAPPSVGGRFSYLTPVGLVSLAFAGRDARALVEGAIAARERNFAPRSPALAYACILKRFYDAGLTNAVFWPYADQLRGLTSWWQQLLAESIGKRRDRDGNEVTTGPMPIAAAGATDQHSVAQLFMEGPADKWFTLVEVASFGDPVVIPAAHPPRASFSYLGGHTLTELLNAERRGTTHALLQAGRPAAVFHVPRIDEFEIGALMLTLMLAVTYAGRLFHVDPYDQPGVEAGKIATFALLGRDGYPGREAIEAALAPTLTF